MADITRQETFQYPAAHYGHLTANQQEALDAFKQLCLEQGYYKPAGTDSSAEASHDDETLLYVCVTILLNLLVSVLRHGADDLCSVASSVRGALYQKKPLSNSETLKSGGANIVLQIFTAILT